MQLEDISAFVRIATAGSLSAAAKASGTPKATLSHHLKRLEKELGIELFVRQSNRLVISDAGQRFLQHANNIKRSCELGLDQIQSFRRIHAHILRIGSSGAFMSNIIGPLIQHFATQHPDLGLEIINLSGSAMWHSFDAVDCIIYVGNPPLPEAAELTSRSFGKFSFSLYASPTFVKRYGLPGTPQDLHRFSLLEFRSGTTLTLWKLRHQNEEYVVKPSTNFLTNDYWSLKLAAVHDHGIAFLPDFFTASEVTAGYLVPILPGWRSPATPISALFPSHRISHPNLRKMINAMAENFDEFIQSPYYGLSSYIK